MNHQRKVYAATRYFGVPIDVVTIKYETMRIKSKMADVLSCPRARHYNVIINLTVPISAVARLAAIGP